MWSSINNLHISTHFDNTHTHTYIYIYIEINHQSCVSKKKKKNQNQSWVAKICAMSLKTV